MNQKTVLHYQDGSIVKGQSNDFFPDKARFHLQPTDGTERRVVDVAELKGVFTVRTFEGDPCNRTRRDVDRAGLGRKIKVTFKDGEVVVGYTSGDSPNRPAFFVFPADPNSNTERIFVVTAATERVEFLQPGTESYLRRSRVASIASPGGNDWKVLSRVRRQDRPPSESVSTGPSPQRPAPGRE